MGLKSQEKIEEKGKKQESYLLLLLHSSPSHRLISPNSDVLNTYRTHLSSMHKHLEKNIILEQVHMFGRGENFEWGHSRSIPSGQNVLRSQ